MDKSVQSDISSKLFGQVSPADIEHFDEVCGEYWTGDCAVFAFNADMYNSGGAVDAMKFSKDLSICRISIKGRGAGRFGAYSDRRPKFCYVNSREEGFNFRSEDNLLTTIIPCEANSWVITIVY
ncbi:galactinol--sucrose galactosyltransferase [Sarracenia purpurea var. burkii]